jgi:hypothetical protein
MALVTIALFMLLARNKIDINDNIAKEIIAVTRVTLLSFFSIWIFSPKLYSLYLKI